jgi:hypothetical protein
MCSMRSQHVVKHSLHLVRRRPERVREQGLKRRVSVAAYGRIHGQELKRFHVCQQAETDQRQWLSRNRFDRSFTHPAWHL